MTTEQGPLPQRWLSSATTAHWHDTPMNDTSVTLCWLSLAVLQNQIIELLPFSIQIRTRVWDGGRGGGEGGGGPLAHTLMEIWQMQTKFWPYNPKAPGYEWKNKTNIKNTGVGCVAWSHLAEDRDQLRAVVNTVMNLHIP